jgi:glycosyltransferase 2 family protein
MAPWRGILIPAAFMEACLRRWQFWAGLAISALFIWLALRGLQLGDVWAALRQANYLWIVPGVATYFLAVTARAWRWHYLLRPVKGISTRSMFPVVAIGYMGNNIYPARAGEVLRSYILHRREGVPMSASLATIVVERAFDGVVMLAFVFLNLPELARISSGSALAADLRTVALWGAAIFLAAVVVFLVMALFPVQSEKLIERLVRRLAPQALADRVMPIAVRFLSGLESLRSPADVGMVLLTSVVIWLLETGKYWFVMQAFPFKVSFFALMLMNGIVNLATTIPSAPGYVGTFDAPGIAVLRAYGVSAGIAAGYTLVLHAALWLPITVLGAIYLARESLSWDRVQAEMAQEGLA